MTSANLLTLTLLSGVVLLVVAIGIRAGLERPLRPLRRPALALRAMLAMYVGLPAFVLLLWLLPLKPAVGAVLLGFAVSPVLPPWAKKAAAAGGRGDELIGLQLLSSAVALLVIPAMIMLACHVLGVQTVLQPLAVELVLLVTVAAPLAVGMGVARLAPATAPRLAALSDRIGGALLLLAAASLLIIRGPAILGVLGQGTLAAIGATVLAGLLIGHLCGGADSRDRGTLASATVYRHPAIALLLASGSNAPTEESVIGAVLLYMVTAVVISIPYERWRRKRSDSQREAVNS